MNGRRSLRCDRTREWISLSLDRELSEFQRALMLAHLRRCPECRRFETEVQGFTLRLRAAPAEPLGRPVALSRRSLRTVPLRLAQVASVALVAVGAGLFGLFLPDRTGGDAGDERALITAPGASAEGWNDLIRDLRRPELKLGRGRVLPSSESGGLGAVKPPLPALPG